MSLTSARASIVLEPAARAFVEHALAPPFIYDLPPAEGRELLAGLQSVPVGKPPVAEEWVTVGADVGDVRVRIVRPDDAMGVLPVVIYLHGGGWVLGDARTHDRLVRELAVGADAAVAFVEYDRAPEARYPIALEQAYATARWLTAHGRDHGIDPHRMAVAGDSSGGNLAAALTLMAKARGDVAFVHQSLYYPCTDAGMDTGSYAEFAEGYHLSAKAMAWFWDQYCPDAERRREPYASPLLASDEQLSGLPPALVVVDECDVLRDEGEAYAARLRAAGVPTTAVRYDGITHDFMMLTPLAGTQATRAAVAQAAQHLHTALHPSRARAAGPGQD